MPAPIDPALPQADVWVRARTEHTPAHRIISPETTGTLAGQDSYRIACPPYRLRGGHAVTLRAAQDLKVFPCMRCFPAAAQRAGQGDR